MGDFWKPTAEMFTALIDRPRMVEKHLVKPPFKFIVDMITSTTRKTNFGNGLFTEQQLNGDYYVDRDKKITYLTKIMRLVELLGGSPVEAKPQKVIAGLEPELTNVFLQQVYKCATSGKSSDPYVKRILNGDEPEPTKVETVKEPPSKHQVKEPPSKHQVKEPPSKHQVKEPPKQESNKMVRPPSATRIKKPAEPIKKIQEEAPPKVEEKQAPKQQYSKKVKELMEEEEQKVKEVQIEDNKNKKQINLGKLGGRKKKGETDKIINTTGELTEKQLELLQSMIQSICQNTAPLGKSIQFINDDVDAMNKELSFWRKQYIASKEKTQRESKITQEALLPVYDKISEVQQQILGQKSKIQTVKSQIIKNDTLVKNLLMSVVTSK